MVLQGIWDYVTTNWIGLLVTAAITAVITLLSVYLTNRALRDYVTSAREERISQAKDELISMLENQIINRKGISTSKIDNLIEAVEREHSVNLSNTVSPITLLQDLELRIEQSSHLDVEQKEEYGEIIEDKIEEINASEVDSLEVSAEIYHAPIIEKIEDAIKSGDENLAQNLIEDLKMDAEEEMARGVEFESPVLRFYSEMLDNPALRIMVVLVYFMMVLMGMTIILF